MNQVKSELTRRGVTGQARALIIALVQRCFPDLECVKAIQNAITSAAQDLGAKLGLPAARANSTFLAFLCVTEMAWQLDLLAGVRGPLGPHCEKRCERAGPGEAFCRSVLHKLVYQVVGVKRGNVLELRAVASRDGPRLVVAHRVSKQRKRRLASEAKLQFSPEQLLLDREFALHVFRLVRMALTVVGLKGVLPSVLRTFIRPPTGAAVGIDESAVWLRGRANTWAALFNVLHASLLKSGEVIY